MEFLNNINKRHVKIITIFSLCAILLLSVPMLLITSMLHKMERTAGLATEYIQELAFDEVILYLDALTSDAKQQSEHVASRIRNMILSTYPNRDDLKNALENIETEGLFDIFHDILEEQFFGGVTNFDNDLFIGNYNGIVFDLNYDDLNEEQSMIRTWEEEASKFYNKDLYLNSIDLLLNQDTSSYIVVEKEEHENPNHTYYSSITKKRLQNIFYDEGIEGLKNYTFYVPTYIYNHKDILGTMDIIDGIKTENFKLIIIQEFNLYDQIKTHYSYLINTNKKDYTVNGFYDTIREYKTMCIITGLCTITFVILTIGLYNYMMSIIKELEVKNKC